VNNKPTTAEIIIMASGAAVLVFSFLDFFGSSKAWDLMPFAFAAIFGAVMAALVAMRLFGNVNTGAGLGGFSWPTIHLVLGFYCAALFIAQLIDGTTGAEIGFWIMLIGSIGLLVGAVMLNQGSTAAPGARPGPGPAV
jgi:hypothetical protein